MRASAVIQRSWAAPAAGSSHRGGFITVDAQLRAARRKSGAVSGRCVAQ